MLGLIFTCLLAMGATPPYLDFSQSGAVVHAEAAAPTDTENAQSVRIGVLCPENSPLGQEMLAAIQIAVDEANARGGYGSKTAATAQRQGDVANQRVERPIPYEVVFRPDDGPWGVATSQVVRLIYDDQVRVILGGLDGQHTHLAELVVAKTWVPVVSPAAIDSTISYANVPWVFRAMPADNQQAELLVKYARQRGFKRLLLLSEGEREAVASVRRVEESARHNQMTFFRQLEYQPDNLEEILPRVHEAGADAIMLWGRTATALPLVQSLRQKGILIPILASSSLAVPEVQVPGAELGELIVAAPCDLSRMNLDFQAFQEKISARLGRQPGPVAIYSYDVARLVLRIIETAGLDRGRIREGLSNANFAGLTGLIQFDSLGGTRAQPVLLSLNKGLWRHLSGMAETAMIPAPGTAKYNNN
jgi:branched-chain amino acid transport system substrate-binding protein